MQSKATTVKQYLAELPPDRREAIKAVREMILANIDRDVEEGMQYGMIGFYIPHRVYPPGYHCDPSQPLPYICLASQKNHMAVYLSIIYSSATEEKWFRNAWAKTGRKLDMGKSCIRFMKLDDLALEVLAEAIRRTPSQKAIQVYESVLKHARKRPTSRTGKKSTASATTRGGAASRKKVG